MSWNFLTSLRLLFWNVILQGNKLGPSSCKMEGLCLSLDKQIWRDIWANQSMKRKCWLLCIQWISSILIYWGGASKLKLTIRASSIFWNKKFHPQRKNEFHPYRNKNQWPRYLDMIMRSFIGREKKTWFSMLFQKSMKKKVPSFPSPSLYHIGSTLFTRNGCKTQTFITRSNNCNTILKLLHGTIGTMKSFATKSICI
jgi:hypothetical protein